MVSPHVHCFSFYLFNLSKGKSEMTSPLKRGAQHKVIPQVSSENFGSNFSSTIHWLCDLGQVTKLPFALNNTDKLLEQCLTHSNQEISMF